VIKYLSMLKYFDNTFFKFFFGFLAILSVSFAIILATNFFFADKSDGPIPLEVSFSKQE